MIDKKRMYDAMVKMVEAPSVSGTPDEMTATYAIEEILRDIPYFKSHPENVMRVPVENDPLDREIVAAYMELAPGNPNTIILTGHYDVVDVEEYGYLQDAAFKVEEITKRIGELPMDEVSRADLESGEWIFGRGTADMKIGHALAMELMRHYDQEGGLNGNILYVAVCGEETNSEGMLAAVPFFNEFAERHQLKYKVLLLMECFMVDKEDDGTKYIQYGGAGKVMPMFFCVGHTTHGEEPFLGLDANMLNAEVYKRMHLNAEFCQKNHGVTTAPPAGLKLQDMKQNYSLSSSLYAASYYNIATIKMQPEETMMKLIKLAKDAFEAVNRDIDEKVAAFADFAGEKPKTYRAQPKVKTFSQIFHDAEKNYDGDLNEDMRKYAAELLSVNPEMQDACVKMVKRIYELQDDKDPMIIVSIIPPYYPDVNIDTSHGDTRKMLECIDELIKYAKEVHGEVLATSEYYGISDLCYTWLADGVNFDGLFENLVGINSVYNFPSEAMKKFKVPALVLGAYGKDLHKYTERLNKHYNFDVLPDLYLKYIDMILNGGERKL